MTPARLAFGLWALLLSFAKPAPAQSNIWDLVRDPEADAKAAARRLVLRYASDPRAREVMAACLTVLPFADAEMKYLCGASLAHGDSESRRQGLELLIEALRDPADSWAGKAWYSFGLLVAERGDTTEVIRAFSRALETLWQPMFRARAYYNRGLAYATRGDFEFAISDYRRSLSLGADPEAYRMAQFGLGVALERKGDWGSALRAFFEGTRVVVPTRRANIQLEPKLATFALLPAYERHYYTALGSMAIGRFETDLEARVRAYETAIVEWGEYLKGGRESGSLYLQRAEAHLERAKRELATLVSAQKRSR